MSAGDERRRVFIVDDHPIVRCGLRQMIGGTSDLRVCGEADTAEAALQLVDAAEADLAIVDLSLGGMSGLDLIRRLRDAAPRTRVLVLSVHDEALFAQRALKAGAHGYITKQQGINRILDAIRHVLAGKIYLSERSSQHVLEEIRAGGSAPDRLGGLTDRELQVFEMIGKGLSTLSIAERLQVSVKTVETYRSNIKAKLHLKDATELLRYATTWAEQL